MRVSLIALVASFALIGIAGCVDPSDVEATSSDQLREAEPEAASTGSFEATPNFISEANWWLCSRTNHYSPTEQTCQQSCTVACRMVTVCVSGTQRVPCP